MEIIWNCEGFRFVAETSHDAGIKFEDAYGYYPDNIRPWTDEDQKFLEEIYG